MAFQFPYDDDYGGSHPAAYARIRRIVYESLNGDEVDIEFALYHDAAARAAGKQALTGIRLSLKRSDNPSLYDAYFADAAMLSLGVSPKRAIYNLVKQRDAVPLFTGATDV